MEILFSCGIQKYLFSHNSEVKNLLRRVAVVATVGDFLLYLSVFLSHWLQMKVGFVAGTVIHVDFVLSPLGQFLLWRCKQSTFLCLPGVSSFSVKLTNF